MAITPRDRKILVAAAIVIPVLLIAYFVFLRPDGGEEIALPESPTGPTGGLPTATPSATPSETPRETLPPVELAGARDPFSIPPGLELAPSGSVSPTPTTSPTVAPTVPPTVSPTVYPTIPPPVYPTPPPPSVSPTPPPPEQPGNKILIGGHDVVLESVAQSGRKVEVRVDGRLYTVEPGATFDDNFMLVRIEGKCARFLFGDQGFELCV
jgi:hypothetical protein